MTDSRRDDVGKQDEYRANAAECQWMAGLTRNQAEQQTWLEMAASWLRMIKRPRQTTSPKFDAVERDRRTGQGRSDRAH
jgi:hypothetical protein